MIWLKLILAIGLPVAGGFFLVSSFLRERGSNFFERLFLGYGAGLGVISYFIFLLGAFEVPYSLASVSSPFLLTGIVFAAVFFLTATDRKGAAGHTPAFETNAQGALVKLLISVLIIWVGFKISFVLFEGLTRPIIAQDSWFNRSAKVFFYAKGLMLDPSNEHFFGRGYRIILGYPLLTFMEQIWVSFVIGGFHESLAKAWAPFYFVSVISLVFFTVKKEGGLLPALLTACLLSAAPLLTFHALESYSDIALSYNLLAGSILLWRYMEKGGGNGEAALSGLFFGMAAFTKSEGLIYLAAAGAALFSYNVIEKRYRWKSVLYFAVAAMVYILPWLIFRAHYGLGYGHGYGTGVGAADELGAIPWSKPHFEIWGIFFKEVFLSVDNGHIFAFLGFISLIGSGVIIRSNIKYLLLILVIILCGFLAVYTMTHDYQYVLNRMATNRNLLTLVPLAALIAGLAATRVAHMLKGG